MKKIAPYKNVTVPIPLRLLGAIEEMKFRHMTSRSDVLRHAIAEGLKYIREQETPFTRPTDREPRP